MKKVISWLIITSLAVIALPTGWYLSRRVATSAHYDQPWLEVPGARGSIAFKEIDREIVAQLRPQLNRAIGHVESFFGRPFAEELAFYVLPDRAALDAHWREAFHNPWFVSLCWMVGTGSADRLSILSPRIWNEEDCGHDSEDAEEVYRLIVHELTHAYHDQINPSGDIGRFDDIGWFIEGLAVHVAGQLEGSRLASAFDAVTGGAAPVELESAWSGRYRYGISGSMVEYVDRRWGRSVLISLLHMTEESDILDALQVSEVEFLDGWEAYVRKGDTASGAAP